MLTAHYQENTYIRWGKLLCSSSLQAPPWACAGPLHSLGDTYSYTVHIYLRDTYIQSHMWRLHIFTYVTPINIYLGNTYIYFMYSLTRHPLPFIYIRDIYTHSPTLHQLTYVTPTYIHFRDTCMHPRMSISLNFPLIQQFLEYSSCRYFLKS